LKKQRSVSNYFSRLEIASFTLIYNERGQVGTRDIISERAWR
jgi:hypothetical protein